MASSKLRVIWIRIKIAGKIQILTEPSGIHHAVKKRTQNGRQDLGRGWVGERGGGGTVRKLSHLVEWEVVLQHVLYHGLPVVEVFTLRAPAHVVQAV